MEVRQTRPTRKARAWISAAALLGCLALAPGAAALQAQTPSVSIEGTYSYAIVYHVIGTATTTTPRPRSEGSIRYRCGGGSWSGTRFVADGSPRTHFTTPTAVFILPYNRYCRIQIDWLIGGGGSAGETGTSPVKLVDTTKERTRPHFNEKTKQKAKAHREVSRDWSATALALAKNGSGSMYPFAALMKAVSTVAERIAQDPPDPRFRKRVRLGHTDPAKFAVADGGSATPAVNAMLAAGTKASDAGIATAKAVDKADGAFRSTAADRKHWERRQMLDAARFARLHASALDLFRTRIVAAATALEDAGVAAATETFTLDEWSTTRTSLLFDGLPPALRAELRRLNVPADLVASAPMHLAVTAPDAGTTLTDVLTAPSSLTAIRELAARLPRWANFIEEHPFGAG